MPSKAISIERTRANLGISKVLVVTTPGRGSAVVRNGRSMLCESSTQSAARPGQGGRDLPDPEWRPPPSPGGCCVLPRRTICPGRVRQPRRSCCARAMLDHVRRTYRQRSSEDEPLVQVGLSRRARARCVVSRAPDTSPLERSGFAGRSPTTRPRAIRSRRSRSSRAGWGRTKPAGRGSRPGSSACRRWGSCRPVPRSAR